ncbi:MAG: hypothetical protein ACRCUB_05160, partial [Plesiomonas shigelloides]
VVMRVTAENHVWTKLADDYNHLPSRLKGNTVNLPRYTVFCIFSDSLAIDYRQCPALDEPIGG